MGFFGGLGTVFGPALGALILEPAQQWLTVQFTNDYLSEILLGVVFLLVILFLPRGVLPTLAERAGQWRARHRTRPAANPDDAARHPDGQPDRQPEGTAS
jgi:branched-chain amino acid transport system permease protein